MSVGRRLLGFAICLVVGVVLAFVALAVYTVLALPHEITGDASVDARYILVGGAVFAVACDAVRGYLARSPPIPRAHTTR